MLFLDKLIFSMEWMFALFVEGVLHSEEGALSLEIKTCWDGRHSAL